MQDRPSAPELLDALAELLFSDVREWVPRERRFQVLVAANLCAVVARELRAGEDPSAADAQLFRSLLDEEAGDPARGEAEAEARDAAERLAKRIRGGALDAELEEVAGRLSEHVRRKLDVARPGYAD
jgi:ABC-type branched-subunit amino acid transport system ATPase component